MVHVAAALMQALLLTVTALTQYSTATSLALLILVDESGSKERIRKKKKREQESRNIMENLLTEHSPPAFPIPYEDRFGRMSLDPARQYTKELASLFWWEIEELADLLEPFISAARETHWRPKPKNPIGKNRVLWFGLGKNRVRIA